MKNFIFSVLRRSSKRKLVQQTRKMSSTLETLNFDNLALRKLPVDEEERNYVRTVRGACFSKVKTTPVRSPILVAYSSSALGNLDLSESEVHRKEFAEYFSGNKILPGSETAAHCYCGHQFGFFSGQLGDGAAIYLGEVVNSKKERWEMQLKGAGLTPFSRTADGRKVLRSSIREFLCSEAMHYLGIPTTRAGACITSDSEVVRDIFYDGNPIAEKCTIVLRIAQTFIRFGSFEIFKTLDRMTGKVGPSVGRTDILHQLLHYVIQTFYPELYDPNKPECEMYGAFLKEVISRTARLVAEWQSVGFCHGVLNTDNMSIVGLTLDYGPFGFLDMYSSEHICNGSDERGRYAFSRQPSICKWNLQKLAEAIEKALPLDRSLPLLDVYDEVFDSHYLSKMKKKIGLISSDCTEDKSLIEELLETMEKSGADFTNTFLCFLLVDASSEESLHSSLLRAKSHILHCLAPLEVLVKASSPNLSHAQIQTFKRISDLGQLEQFGSAGALVKEILSKLETAEALSEMTQESKMERDDKLWTEWLLKYRKRVQKDVISFSAQSTEYNEARLKVMKQNNPRYILRNYICQNAIEKAENGDFSEVQCVLEMLKRPYDHSYIEANTEDFVASTSCSTESFQLQQPPRWAMDLKVT